MEKFLNLIAKFPGAKILVLGDIMVDQYVDGKVERISPEAPVPVILVRNETYLLGGAANVVNNISDLQGNPIMIGVVGDDDMGKKALSMFKEKGIPTHGVLVDSSRRTTLKTRIIAHSQQVVRVDREDTFEISAPIKRKISAILKKHIPLVDCVVISDYMKGVVCASLVKQIIAHCRQLGKMCIVDPKVEHFKIFKGTTIITPNHHEAGRALGMEIKDDITLKKAGIRLLEEMNCQAILITFGEQGMGLFEKNGKFTRIRTVARRVYDVTGAGDTVISVLSMALSSGADFATAAELANLAAGIVVEQFGTVTISKSTLENAVKENRHRGHSSPF